MQGFGNHLIMTDSIVYKFYDDDGQIEALGTLGLSIESILEKFSEKLIEKRAIVGNVITNTGVSFLLKCLVQGQCHPPFSPQYSHIAVGDSDEPERPEHNILLGLNKHYRHVDYNYPLLFETYAVFRATFGRNHANFEWKEWSVTNGSTPISVHLNRKVEHLGKKEPNMTWLMQVTFSFR